VGSREVGGDLRGGGTEEVQQDEEVDVGEMRLPCRERGVVLGFPVFCEISAGPLAFPRFLCAEREREREREREMCVAYRAP